MEGKLENIQEHHWGVKTRQYLNLAAAALILITPVAYLSGWAYSHAYLTAFGVPGALIHIAPDEAFISAFWFVALQLLAVLEPVTQVPKWILAIAGFISVFILMATVAVLIGGLSALFELGVAKLGIPVKSVLLKARDNNALNHAVDFTEKITLLGGLLSCIAFIVLFSALIGSAAYAEGKKQALQSQEVFKQEGCGQAVADIWSSCVEIVDTEGGVVESGKLIHDTAQGMAIYTGEMTKILTLAPDQYLRFTQIPQKTEG